MRHSRALLADEPARRYADRIDWLELDPRWRALSATAVRERLARGEPAAEWLPEPVERYLRRARVRSSAHVKPPNQASARSARFA